MNKPFNQNYFIGYINHVNPQFVKVHFPSSVLLNKFLFSGEEFNGGLIGNFVTIEGENHGFIGKITELDLPEKERLSLNEKAFQSSNFHPTAKVEILLCFDYYDSEKGKKSLGSFPNIGAKVYVCPSKFIQSFLRKFGQKQDKTPMLINIGALTSNKNTNVQVSQQAMFGRHCAIVGTTGGGKSWSVAKLIESMKENHTKAILIDPTGEYSGISDDGYSKSTILSENSYFHYRKLTIDDLFFLVKPAGRVQAPKLLEAIRSLKAVELNVGTKFKGFVDEKGLLTKTGLNKMEYGRFYYSNISKIDNSDLTFKIINLPKQIINECIWEDDRENKELFGGKNDTDISNCISLVSRMNNILHTEIFSSIFGFDKEPDTENDLTT